ncbi:MULTISPECIES: CBS domain-containing protein [unclassified Ectothiorhodospira]|uniref:CBS domain-containing protein n=1 Tax=unclassified Ectothiorhodospira TaxID=2684909 RepID=UPI001EE9658F|nr:MULTISPECIES: CBS domain-containing protein [unclassified Ectothiorhodospira]MCG5517149.1 CBS domain-containing protein [Ectothiorhodospira sp. 9100]MCG5520036.1 CBS domain-containing protein [Ectothiorhodospira sp. 9905]
MAARYALIPSHTLSEHVTVHRFGQGLPSRVTMEDPAADVMTDFRRVEAVTAPPEMPMDAALQKMIHAGVRLLIVVDRDEGVLGVVTARDIMGEKPVKTVSDERIAHNDLLVQHVMTPRGELSVMDHFDVVTARVGDVVVTLRDAGRQHALVVEYDDQRREILRGLFSLTQIGRQLGVEITSEGPVQSFAQIEKLLNR